MAPEEALTPAAGPSEASPAQEGERPRRRPGRGHRGRGRRRPPPPPSEQGSQAPAPEPHSQTQHEPEAETERQAGEHHDPGEMLAAEPETSTQAARSPGPARQDAPASAASVQQAIEQVSEIIQTLRDSLDEMEEVLEMLEAFQRQGDADEREIENLRRALRQLQRPRDGGQHAPRRS